MILWSYPFWLALISIGVALAERIRPWRPAQKALRRTLWSDLGHLVINGHFLGVAIYGIYTSWIAPHMPAFPGFAAAWPIWAQIIVAVIVADFLQWCVHNALHRFAPLWQFHKVHHSVVDGEMDWIVSFRFHWMEAVIYKSLLYVPLALFGFGPEAVLFHAVFGTLIGHLNHANLDLGHGKWRYVINNPRMHIWHHDYDGDLGTTKNFGIIFSCWDWIFGTAHVPSEAPKKIGFSGVERVPSSFVAHAAWPMRRAPVFFGVAVMAVLWALGHESGGPSGSSVAEPPGSSLGPHPGKSPPDANSSQPVGPIALNAPSDARRALARAGDEARAAGWAHPEAMISARELSDLLGLPELVLLDVRPKKRFEQGHLPTAQVFERADYALPIGLSKSGPELEEALRARGATKGSVIVLYGDGGAEPYRVWWTLREVLGLQTRVLDGGIQAYKQLGAPVAIEPAQRVPAGDLALGVDRRPRGEQWSDVQAFIAANEGCLLDTRTVEEFTGATKNEGAARAGRIPGSRHLSWGDMIVGLDDPRLLPRDQLALRVKAAGIELDQTVVSYCQSATRSSVTYYALWQLGMPDERLLNYGGSWAVYSRTELPIATGE